MLTKYLLSAVNQINLIFILYILIYNITCKCNTCQSLRLVVLFMILFYSYMLIQCFLLVFIHTNTLLKTLIFISLQLFMFSLNYVNNYLFQLQTRGLDLSFLLNNLLHDQLSKSLKGHRQKVIDATNLRNSEEVWRQINTGTPQVSLKLLFKV